MKRSAVWKTVSRRGKGLGASLCALALAALAVWQGPQEAQAAYLDPYIERVTQLGLMRGDIDGNLMPESDISRAEFVTIVNRAFGYDEMGGIPFDDVPEEAWYAEDVDIGYTAGYITGTSESTFSPLEPVTREQAAVMLARNLVMQPAVGENVSFTDSRDLSAWSRGLVSTASQYNLISGYPDGSFHPQDAITRGEAAIMLLNAVGTPIQEPGVQSLGNVWGNVTITTSGVTLRDTVVGGNLYITAGVGLGDVILENVTVLGEIVVSGGGVSERGDDSVVLRNVNAPTLVVDNIRNQHVSLRVEGDGVIDNASIRTDAYLVDNTPSNAGVLRMELNGEEGLSLTLGGNIKEVINKTPESTLSLSSGQASVITVDEAATGSVLEIASGAEAGTVNLDTATQVTGDGDIGHLVVNAGGSTVSMLPDQITIRPGIDATIDGETMDSEAAAEASADPRLLAGYPRITDLAPTTATAQFSGNKRGTVYWAVTSVTDGSVGTGDLINPPSYTTNIVANGTVSLSGANEPATVQINRLTSDGSYYLSTVMVDARGDQSPLKVISFTTPDNSVPDFADGYPYLSRITNVSVQATVMATKTCRLYWAVLPDGASAPTAQDFRANAVTGNLGFGTLDVTKNTAYSFDANNVALEELEDYTLYLWLTDIGGGQSSRVESLDFTTVDRTPPRFNTDATVNEVERTSVGLYANLNEDGTLYWVVVPQGEEYPKPLAGQSGAVDLGSDTAKLQVSSGMNALKSGNVRMREGQDVEFRISGLDPETAYDLYYVAQDTAGNYSARVQMITIHTLDPNAPTVTQEFTEYNGTETTVPLPDTDIRLVFNETVQDVNANKTLVSYYEDVLQATTVGGSAEEDARNAMETFLRNSIHLYVDNGNGRPQLAPIATTGTVKTGEYATEWVIDYRYAEIALEEGKTVVTFRNTGEDNSALNLGSGVTYYFEIQANTICDTSDARNTMGTTRLDEFTTVFAQVNLSVVNTSEIDIEGGTVDANAIWRLDPAATDRVDDSVDWDMLIWTDTNISFNLYQRTGGSGLWTIVNEDGPLTIQLSSTVEGFLGVSLTKDIINENPTFPEFDQLNSLKENEIYEYAIEFVTINGEQDKTAWNGRVNIKVNIVAGSTLDLRLLANELNSAGWEDNVVNGNVSDIGLPQDFTIIIPFTDQSAPRFRTGYPLFNVESSTVEMQLALDRPGTIYYIVAPRGDITTEGTNGDDYRNQDNWIKLPDGDGILTPPEEESPALRQPIIDLVLNPETFDVGQNLSARYGSIDYASTVAYVNLEGLRPEAEYTVYFVLQNTAQRYSEVLCYRFTTTEVATPYITLSSGDGTVYIKTSEDSRLSYIIATSQDILTTSPLNDTFAAVNGQGNPVFIDQANFAAFQASGLDQSMTVFDALATTVEAEGAAANEGPSVFDLYANDAIKARIGQWVRSSNQSDIRIELIQPSKQLSMEQGVVVEEDLRELLDQRLYYACIAVAYNDDGTLDGFKALDNISVRDSEPPTLMVTNSGQTKDGNTWSGTLTLTFSENLYWLSGSDGKTTKAVIGNSVGTTDPTNIGILDCISKPTENIWVISPTNTPGTVFEIGYQNLSVGRTITLFTNGLVCDRDANPRDQITLQFMGDIGYIVNDDSVPGFVIVNGRIDGDLDDRDLQAGNGN